MSLRFLVLPVIVDYWFLLIFFVYYPSLVCDSDNYLILSPKSCPSLFFLRSFSLLSNFSYCQFLNVAVIFSSLIPKSCYLLFNVYILTPARPLPPPILICATRIHRGIVSSKNLALCEPVAFNFVPKVYFWAGGMGGAMPRI